MGLCLSIPTCKPTLSIWLQLILNLQTLMYLVASCLWHMSYDGYVDAKMSNKKVAFCGAKK